jgi:hypothetical protein
MTFKLFKKITCKHFKKSGEGTIPTMKEIVRFSESEKETGTNGYGIYECQNCGHCRYWGEAKIKSDKGKKARTAIEFSKKMARRNQ